MSLKSSNKVDTNVWELEVSVDGDTFKDAVTKAYLKQRKNITIPGFRKGKAPRAFIEKYYGKEVFYEDAINGAYPDALDEAIKELMIDPLLGEQKKGDLAFLRVHKFSMVNQLTLLGYSYEDGTVTLELMALGSHENFYRDIKKIF